MNNIWQFVSLIIIIYIIYRYIKLYLKINALEYEFTSVVNHTFRTPLTRINWLTKELEKELSEKEKKMYLRDMTNATNKILEIVDLFAGIKNIQDTSSYYFEAISIREIIEKTISKYREEINKKNISFKIPIFKNVPMLTLDIKKIAFVIDTLIENAIFYTPQNGVVEVTYINNPEKIVLIVKDSGIGLNPKNQKRIFDRFYRSKEAVLKNPDGMGLKLYLVKEIIKRHKGKIYIQSDGLDKGATFFVELPFHR